MITLNKKADIFVFPENEIIILLDGKIIEIKGRDTWFVAKLFKNIYCNKLCIAEIIKLAEGREKVSSIRGVVSRLEKLGIVTDAQKEEYLTSDFRILPYTPLLLKENIWYCRRGENFYFFFSSNRKEANRKIKEIALNWIQDGEIRLFLDIANQKADCLPGQFLLPSEEGFIKTNLSEKARVVIFDSKKKKYSVVQNSFSSGETARFWSELAKRTTGELGLVPLLKKVRTNKIPFEVQRYAYVASHKLADLTDEIVDFQIGTDEMADIAKVKAIMESIERYCGRKSVNSNTLMIAPFKELNPDEVISPIELAQFSDHQFAHGWLKGIKRFDPEDVISWIKVRDILTGETKKAPLSFVSYAQKISKDICPRHFFANSSGMAAHTILDEAIRKSALEIIERDAILIHWFNKIKPKRIILANIPDYIHHFSAGLEKLGHELYLVDLTLDTTPVIMAMAVNEDGEFPFFCGAASCERKIDAIKKAVEELEFTIWSRIKYRSALRQKIKDVSLKTIRDPADHEALYLKPEMFKHLKFLTDGPTEQTSESELYSTTDLHSVLDLKGFKLYYLEMTAKEVKQLGLGIKVVRAIIPGFVPITFGYGQEPLGMKRIYEVPVKLGFRNREIAETEIIESYLPHFFP